MWSRDATRPAPACQHQPVRPVSPSWPPHVVDHDGGFAAIGETLVAAGDSPLPSALEIPRDVAPGARARSGPRRRGEGSWLDRPDGRTERDQAGRARADGRHGVARSASHRHAPAGSRSGAAVSPSRSRWSSSPSSFPRRAARGAAAASFTPPSPRPPRVGGICHPCRSSRGGHATNAPGGWVDENIAGGYEGEHPMLVGVRSPVLCPVSGARRSAGAPAQRIDSRYARRVTRRSTPSLPRMLWR